MYKYLLISFLFGLFLPLAGNGQAGLLSGNFIRYNAANGFPHGAVEEIEQDSFGRIWLGTSDGLCHFDGHRFELQPLADSEGQAPSTISEIMTDGSGRLWVGTDRGLFLRVSSSHFSLFSDDPIFSAYVFDLFINQDKSHLYAIVKKKNQKVEIVQVDLEKLEHKVFTHPEFPTRAQLIWQHQNENEIWLGGEQLLHFDLTTEEVTKVPGFKKGYALEIEDIDVHNGKWFVTSRYAGILVLDKKKKKWTGEHFVAEHQQQQQQGSIYLTGARQMVQKNDSTFFVVTDKKGFGEFYPFSGQFSFYENSLTDPSSIFPGSAQDVFVDSEKNVWVGLSAGLAFYNQKIRGVKYIPVGLNSGGNTRSVLDVAASPDNNVIVLARGGGAFDFFDKDFNFIKNNGFKNELEKYGHYCRNLVEAPSGKVYGVSNFGLVEVDFEEKKIDYVIQNSSLHQLGEKDKLNSCRVAPDGMVWIVTKGGHVILYDENKKLPKVIKLPMEESVEKYVYEVAFSGGKIFVSSFGGLFEIVDEKAIEIELPNIEPSMDVMFAVTGIDEKSIAIGTRRGGLYIYNHLLDSLRMVQPEQGMKSNYIDELIQDEKGNIWGVTPKGMMVYFPVEDRVVFFDEKDGMVKKNVVHEFLDLLPDGRVVVSLENGLQVFEPDVFLKREKVKPLIVSEVNGEYWSGGKGYVELPHDNSFLYLKFASFEFSPANKPELQYRVLPTQPEWTALKDGEMELKFLQLSPGAYEVQLRGENRWGAISPTTSLQVKVQAPFYRKPIFIFCSSLFLIGSAAFFTWYILRRNNREKRLKEVYEKELNEMELRALRAHMNPHFLFNSLNSIRYFVQKNDSQLASSYISKFSQLLRFIVNHSDKKTVTLGEELEALQLYLEFESLRFDEKFDYHIKIGKDVDVHSVQVQPLLLQPFVENAIWHGVMKSGEEGEVGVNVFKKENEIWIVLEDNGEGIDMDNFSELKNKRAGLNLVEKRVKLFNQKNTEKIKLEYGNINPRNKRKGTRVVLRIILNKKNESDNYR